MFISTREHAHKSQKKICNKWKKIYYRYFSVLIYYTLIIYRIVSVNSWQLEMTSVYLYKKFSVIHPLTK